MRYVPPAKVDRNQLVLVLRGQGFTYKAIAERVGCSAGRVRQIVYHFECELERIAEVLR